MTFTGEAVDDTLLQFVATSETLTSLSISSAPCVTDAGISAAAMAATQLTTLCIEGASASETFGHFLPKVLALPHLACLTVDTPLLDLEDLPRAATWCDHPTPGPFASVPDHDWHIDR